MFDISLTCVEHGNLQYDVRVLHRLFNRIREKCRILLKVKEYSVVGV